MKTFLAEDVRQGIEKYKQNGRRESDDLHYFIQNVLLALLDSD